MRWKDLRVVAFDTETTGLHPFAGDRIIEFAAVVFQVGRAVEPERHSFLVNPERPIPRKVTDITGIKESDVSDKPPFSEIAMRVHELLQGSIAVAHNFPFDLAFITQELRRCGLHWPEPLAEIDTVDLSIRMFPDVKGHKLSDLCRRLQVPLENAHRATDDAEACGQCFVELARRHGVEDDLQALLDWSGAIGRPPENGPLGPDDQGRIVFREGPHVGKSVSEHPVYLAWMTKARERGADGWRWTFPESTRRWIARWLQVRGAGRARQNIKSFRPDDWVVDNCIAVDPRVGL